MRSERSTHKDAHALLPMGTCVQYLALAFDLRRFRLDARRLSPARIKLGLAIALTFVAALDIAELIQTLT